MGDFEQSRTEIAIPARPNRRLRHAVGTFFAVLFACAAVAAQAHATTFTAATGDGSTTVCPNPASGTCTLRQLILYENQNAPNPPDTISVPAGFYFLTNQALTITRSVSIVGEGARSTTVDQGSSTPDRVFDIQVPNGGSAPTVSISGLTIESGTANSNNGFFGGNVRNAGANLTLSDDWITNGTTSFGSGGGVSNDAGTLLVQRSLIANNNGGNDSGGIQNFGSSSQAGDLTVINSTIANNSSQQGGGIFSWCNSVPCTTSGQNNTTTVINSTIVHNDGGPRNAGGGGLLQGAGEGTMSVRNSIVAFNTVSTPAAGTPTNCGGSGISSGGYNIESLTDCGFTLSTDHQSTDPKLTSTGTEDWGGNTDTFSLDARSPAVDAIPPNAANCGGTDQRGTHRPQGQGCDIGAFELFQPVEGAQAQIQTLADPCGVFGSATINWGDNTSSQSQSGTFVGTHTYARAGIYDGSATYTNDCGTHTNVPFDVKVQNGIVATGSAITPTAGTPFTKPVATFSDDTPGRGPSNFSASINWGDGSSSAGTVSGGGGSFTVSGGHTYATAAPRQTTITITDVGGASATTNGSATVTTNPSANPSKPLVSSTTAQFSGTVNPQGSLTTVHFEYGLDPADRGPGFSGNVYDQSTALQSVGSDYASHFVAGSASKLMPKSTYHVRLVAINGAGVTFGPDQVFTTPAAGAPPPPVVGKTLNFMPSGTVFVLLQGQFVKLTQALQLPSGTIVDALHGSVALVAAGGGSGLASDARVKKGKKVTKGTGKFGGAVFKVSQARSGPSRGLTTLSLVEAAFKGGPAYATCKARAAADAHAAISRRILQTLHARATGRFRTRGRYAAGTVRGTAWTTSDRCDGTLIAVQQHSVLVSDLVKHISILVRSGHHYLAQAPAPTKRK